MVTMTVGMGACILLAASVLAALAISYWGAGMLLYPPFMSPMAVFPERFGVAYEKVSLRASDGHALAGWFLTSPEGRTDTLVLCHGWGDNKGELLKQTLFLNRDAGYNLLYFDFRGHGESQASQVTLGKLELLDLAAALAWAAASRPGKLGLFGLSMGASVAAMALKDHPEVGAAILESPFAGLHEVGRRWTWLHLHAPYFPLVWLFMRWARLRSGHADIDSYSPEDYIGAAGTPILFIAAERDTLMPPKDVGRLRDRAGGPTEFWTAPGATHGKCREAAPAEYDARVTRFLKTHLAGQSDHAQLGRHKGG